MSNLTITQIRETIEALMLTIKPVNGYLTNIQPGNEKPIIRVGQNTSPQKTDYPSWNLTTDSMSGAQQASGRLHRIQGIWVTTLFREFPGGGLSIREQCEAFIDDLDRMVASNHDLSGLAQNFTLVNAVTDSGVAYPEGLVLSLLEVEYYKESM